MVLDACLARGTKRKLRQRTLLQLNFCSQSKVETHSCESDHTAVNDDVQKGPPANILCETIHNLNGFVGAEDDTRQSKSILNSESVLSTDGSAEDLINDDSVNCRVDSPSLVAENEMPEYEMGEPMANESTIVLNTYIVGRKFSDEVKLNPGATITLLRDPDNIKDLNAIKVIFAESGCYKMLGFLPRELAQYLSPLIDNYCLSFEGCVTSIPKRSLDNLPIQIMCPNNIFSGEKDYDDLQEFKSLWRNAFRVAESSKNHPPSTEKYHQNFSLLLQEVLRSYPCLFSYDEKILLGNEFSN
ncbi:phosphodiesterase I [Sarracenia purpurea var. burkii]